MDALRGFIVGIMLGILGMFTYAYYSDDGAEYTREDMIMVMEDIANRSIGPDDVYVTDNITWVYVQYNGQGYITQRIEWTIDEYLELILEK